MNAAERHSKILEWVALEGSVTIAQLSERFEVSDMTARRDLNELNRQGLLRRVHGGAVANLGRSYEPAFKSRETKNKIAKIAIGKKAAELVYDGDSIALDVGTTTVEIVPWLAGKRNLTVVTNCLQIANRVVETFSLDVDARLILAGGVVRPRELSMVGSIPEVVYRDLHVDKAFIAIGGLSLTDGLTEYNLEDTQIKKILLQQARESILVADSSKFGLTTFSSVGPINSVSTIITDNDAPEVMVYEIRQMGIEVVLVDPTEF
jgi:DeoR/GlpR family transcriptional regulator of sugar metabolism